MKLMLAIIFLPITIPALIIGRLFRHKRTTIKYYHYRGKRIKSEWNKFDKVNCN